MNTNSFALAEKLQSRDATREPTWVRYTLLTIALIFFLSCLILPLILVFVEAFKQGVGVYFQSLVHPDTLSAVKLTLLTRCFPANALRPLPRWLSSPGRNYTRWRHGPESRLH